MTALAALIVLATTPEKLPITGLTPARVVPDLCKLQYRVSTGSPQCQTFCDQAAGYFYSYVWMEAARNFETALRHDPDCAFAWLGLHRALEKWPNPKTPRADPFLALVGGVLQPKLPPRYAKPPRDYALEMAKALMPKASHREGLLITAKLQEKGLLGNLTGDERKKKAIETLDDLLALHEDDEEGWFARAQLAGAGPPGMVTLASVPFYKSLLKVNPLHPGANHELVHFYEGYKRPALGWPYAEKFIESSPSIPHAYHMQAHLAMRIGKWQQSSDWSVKALELQRAYHKDLRVKPNEDHQYNHHLQTLTRSLVHDGRFAEVKQMRTEAERCKYTFNSEWLRTAILMEDWADAEKLIAGIRKTDKAGASYWSALVALAQNDTSKAQAELDAIRQSKLGKKSEIRQWEIQGRVLCATGDGDAGLKLLRKAVEKTKDDYGHHAWGNGASLMETWGEAALDCGNVTDAGEAFQEALAHDTGSVKGALGMWALCSKLGKTDEAERYLKLARKCWSRAESKDFERLKETMAKRATAINAGE